LELPDSKAGAITSFTVDVTFGTTAGFELQEEGWEVFARNKP